ncbi:hypothetical protein [Thiomicrorhabdus indica]|uniref:hypothetical protein n=1 Tax=Thiomicrorhabdus indica TaxID=2267253 RepID=UPI00102DCA1B|nr:hypothetical protein [Thiomicrorhabdus indica]
MSIENLKQIYIENLCFIMPLKKLRETPNVSFFQIDGVVNDLSGIDLVIHGEDGRSPTIEGDDTWYWYMHTDQEDKLVVHEGVRLVQLYSKKHGKVENFKVTPNAIFHNDKKIFEGSAILGWMPHVFHRVHSPHGSVSTNYATRAQTFDMDTNFNIYTLDVRNGNHEVARIGSEDQPKP